MLGTLLLVDDEPNVLSGLCRVLFDEPYEVLTATSAVDGLAILAKQPVDVLVVDERMPGMQGSEMLAHVRRDYPAIVSMVLTGHASVESAVRAINEGKVFKFLHKPCDADELKLVIREAFQETKLASASAQVLAFANSQRSTSHPVDGVRAFTASERALLSAREQEVLVLFARGYKASQIAQSLCLSPETVRSHRKSLYRKLDVHSQAELVSKFYVGSR